MVAHIFKGLSGHIWKLDEQQSRGSINSYYERPSTGDRKVHMNVNVDGKISKGQCEVMDIAWLRAGSGHYFVQPQFRSEPSYWVHGPAQPLPPGHRPPHQPALRRPHP